LDNSGRQNEFESKNELFARLYDELKKKLIQKIKDPEDSRISLLSLTAAGQRKLNEINSFIEEIHHQVLLQMAPDQRKSVLTNLDILKASMEAVREMMV